MTMTIHLTAMTSVCSHEICLKSADDQLKGKLCLTWLSCEDYVREWWVRQGEWCGCRVSDVTYQATVQEFGVVSPRCKLQCLFSVIVHRCMDEVILLYSELLCCESLQLFTGPGEDNNSDRSTTIPATSSHKDRVVVTRHSMVPHRTIWQLDVMSSNNSTSCKHG